LRRLGPEQNQMSRVETLQKAASRTTTPAQSRGGAARQELASFSLPEMLNQAAARQVARPAAAIARNEVGTQRAAAERARAQAERPEPQRVDRDTAPRSRPSDRASEARSRRDTRRADDEKPVDKPATQKADRAEGTEHEVSAVGTSQADPGARDAQAPVDGAAAEATAETASSGPGEPGLMVAGAIGLAIPEVLASATKGAAAGDGGLGGVGKGKAPGLRGAAAARAGETAGQAGTANKGEAAEGDEHAAAATDGKPAIPVFAALLGKGSEGGEGGSKGGISDLLNQLQDPTPQGGAAGRPAFADMLDGAKAAEAKAGATAQRAIVTDVAVGRVPIEIGLKALEGSNRFDIKLSPDELGRVDVKLDIDDSGSVRAHLTVERPEALALLTRDRAQLERAFEQAGLKPADDAISFSLRDGTADNGGRGMGDGNDRPRPQGGRTEGIDEIGPKGGAAPALPRAILSRLGALDLRI
jgi:flagellar hook-length control protein FliK